jgi:MYXO-CTERM domain-containing protein
MPRSCAPRLFVVTLAVVLGQDVSAWACSLVIPCPPARLLPRLAPPANLPAFVVYPHPDHDGSPAAFRLFDASGQAVPLEVTETFRSRPEYVLTLPAPLVPGQTYRLEAEVTDCQQGRPTETTVVQDLTATDPAPLPDSVGELLVLGTYASRAVRVRDDSPGSCGYRKKSVPAAGVILRLRASDAVLPFLGTARFRVLLAGSLWAETRFGGLSPAGVLRAPSSVEGYYDDAGVVHVDCDPAYREPGAPGPGRHLVEVEASIAGVEGAIATTSLEVDFVCPDLPDGGPDGGEPPADGGGDDVAGERDASGEDAGGEDAVGPATRAELPPGGEGCQCRSAGGHGGRGGALLLLAVVVFGAARRRR